MKLEEMKNLPEHEQKAIFSRLSDLRKKGKTTNYSSTYGVGKAKLARDLSVSVKDAARLLDAYWKRNWAITKVASDMEIKYTGQSMWLKNPISGFYHQLRAEKDVWSTLNQSSGTYCFDTWVYFVRKLGTVVNMQFHDEVGFYVDEGKEGDAETSLKKAIGLTNDKLKLNIQLDVDVKFGKSYSETH